MTSHVCNNCRQIQREIHLNKNLYSYFEQVFTRCNERVALDAGEEIWTYAKLSDVTNRLAGALVEEGICAGDRVVVQAGKCPLGIALYLACLKIGAVYVPLNTAYTVAEVDYFIGDAEPKLLVLQEESSELTRDSHRLWTLNEHGEGTVAALAAASYRDVGTMNRGSSDLAAILYTSGTTGRPKGAMLSHENVLSNAQTLVDYWAWEDDDVLLHSLPIYHVHGLFVALHCVFLTGTKFILHPRFDVADAMRDLRRSTVFMGVPTYYSRFVGNDEFNRSVVENMRLFISGSAPLSEQLFTLFEQRTGMRILERYGMSETLMLTSNPYSGERKEGTVGFPLPAVRLRIADEQGNELAHGEIGGIEVRGPNVFGGYWRLPDKTEEEFRSDGFFKTGDMGFKDADGRVSIVGREKDVVISGGLNVYPAEVEAAIEQISGVAENAVVGVPHPDFGEAVVSVVVSDQDIELSEIRLHLASRLARFKHPKAVHRVTELPRNAMGKIQKNELRSTLANLFTKLEDQGQDKP